MRYTGGLVPVAVRKAIRNHPNASVTWSSWAVYGPHMGKKLEQLWVIPWHAMQDRKTFRRFLDLYGHHRAHSRKLSLHNFPTWAFYDFGTIVWVLYGTTRPLSHVWAHKGPGWVLTVPYGSALKAIVYGSCGLRTSSVCCLEILRSPTQAVTIMVGLHTGVHKPVSHPQGPVRCHHDLKEHI